MQQSYITIQDAATIQGHGMLVGEERKLAAHADDCRAVDISLYSSCGGDTWRME